MSKPPGITIFEIPADSVDPALRKAAADGLAYAVAALGPSAAPVDGLIHWFVRDRVPGSVEVRTDFVPARPNSHVTGLGGLDLWLCPDWPGLPLPAAFHAKRVGESAVHEAMHCHQVRAHGHADPRDDVAEQEAQRFASEYSNPEGWAFAWRLAGHTGSPPLTHASCRLQPAPPMTGA